MFDRQVMNKFYSNAKRPSDIPWHRDEPDEFLKKVIKARGRPGRALDIGCGTGSFSVYLAKQGYTVTGLDMFSKALEMGRERAQRENVIVNWVQADLFAWQPDEKFEIILDSGCLHSLVGGNVARYKKQLLSWLAPSGDYVLGHWGKKHMFDWLPIGPRRRSLESILKIFSPELKMVDHVKDTLTNVPRPFGPTIVGYGIWFKKN